MKEGCPTSRVPQTGNGSIKLSAWKYTACFKRREDPRAGSQFAEPTLTARAQRAEVILFSVPESVLGVAREDYSQARQSNGICPIGFRFSYSLGSSDSFSPSAFCPLEWEGLYCACPTPEIHPVTSGFTGSQLEWNFCLRTNHPSSPTNTWGMIFKCDWNLEWVKTGRCWDTVDVFACEKNKGLRSQTQSTLVSWIVSPQIHALKSWPH